MTEAAEDRCWNCGIVPKRWFDVTPRGLDEQRLLCSNCFARTTKPRILLRLAEVTVARSRR